MKIPFVNKFFKKIDYNENNNQTSKTNNNSLNSDNKKDSALREIHSENVDGEKAFNKQPIRKGRCSNCKKLIEGEEMRPPRKWNLPEEFILCSNCFIEKEKQHEKLTNFCNICGKKLNFVRYNPKPAWKLSGQLCRKCWDSENAVFNSNKKKI